MKKIYYCHFNASMECTRKNKCSIYFFAQDITDDERKMANKMIRKNPIIGNISIFNTSLKERVIATVDLCKNYKPSVPVSMSPAQRFQR